MIFLKDLVMVEVANSKKQHVSFKIKGMDCAEEVAVLKRTLGPVTGGEQNLNFDVLQGKMTIIQSDNPLEILKIQAAVSKTGMRAIPWDNYHNSSEEPGKRRN
ncbi:MAG: heavy-metal-associated domain-containing protein [Candidatus Electryonea clarkiae]|nr:heavy-metal-associated domain-containing protein [Candidatus Electryonea clarkiae]MDP8289067.1 heavy-metal-associated domain-containing protein [Candidatus Electryonea clarkiae]